jgi:hypothetical protein
VTSQVNSSFEIFFVTSFPYYLRSSDQIPGSLAEIDSSAALMPRQPALCDSIIEANSIFGCKAAVLKKTAQ